MPHAFRDVAAGHFLDRLGSRAGSVAVNVGAVARLAAQQRIDRHVGAFALDVPQRLIDPAHGVVQHGAVPPVRADVHRLPDVLDMVGVFTLEKRAQELVHRGDHGPRALGEGGAAVAVQARLAGLNLDDDRAGQAGRRGQNRFHVGDFQLGQAAAGLRLLRDGAGAGCGQSGKPGAGDPFECVASIHRCASLRCCASLSFRAAHGKRKSGRRAFAVVEWKVARLAPGAGRFPRSGEGTEAVASACIRRRRIYRFSSVRPLAGRRLRGHGRGQSLHGTPGQHCPFERQFAVPVSRARRVRAVRAARKIRLRLAPGVAGQPDGLPAGAARDLGGQLDRNAEHARYRPARRGRRFCMPRRRNVTATRWSIPNTRDIGGNVNPVGPRSVYDEAKRFAEALTMAYHREYGVNTHLARLFNTYGPRMKLDDGRVVPAFLAQALQGRGAYGFRRRLADAQFLLRIRRGARDCPADRERRAFSRQHRRFRGTDGSRFCTAHPGNRRLCVRH